MKRRTAGLAALLLAALSGKAASQTCSQQSFAVAPSQFSGARINSIAVATNAPDDWMQRAPLINRLHSRTHASRIRTELLFAAGDSVDTLRVAESMRRLRSAGLFDRTELLVSACPGQPGVDITISTRDAWTLTPVIKAHSGSADLGFAERNAFGTGASARFVLHSDRGALGLGISARILGKPFHDDATELGSVRYANGQSWYAIAGNRTVSSANKSTLYLKTSWAEKEPRTQPGNNYQRSDASLLIGRRFAGGLSSSASYFLYGAEIAHADLHSPPGNGTMGTQAVRRSYAGVNLGFARVAAVYDTISWMLNSNGLVDVPSGIESEIVVGVGRDKITANTAQHLDGWMGRTFLSRNRNTILLADVWASGFAGVDLISASTLRSSWTLLHRANRGYWTWRVTGERLGNPDPDVRALASVDPLVPALPTQSKLAEAAVAFSVERTAHLFPVTRSLVLDAAVFGGASYRWDAASTATYNSFGALVTGVGLRLNPSRTPRNSVRLDFGVPISRSSIVSRKPYFAVTITTWPFFDRQRDGRKTP